MPEFEEANNPNNPALNYVPSTDAVKKPRTRRRSGGFKKELAPSSQDQMGEISPNTPAPKERLSGGQARPAKAEKRQPVQQNPPKALQPRRLLKMLNRPQKTSVLIQKRQPPRRNRPRNPVKRPWQPWPASNSACKSVVPSANASGQSASKPMPPKRLQASLSSPIKKLQANGIPQSNQMACWQG